VIVLQQSGMDFSEVKDLGIKHVVLEYLGLEGENVVQVSDSNRMREQDVQTTVDVQTEDGTENNTENDTENELGAETDSEPEDDIPQYLFEQLYEKYPELLVLVNKEQELSEDYDPGLMTMCYGRLEVSKWLSADLEEMEDDAEREGCGFWVASGYRSRDYQQGIVDDDVAKYLKEGMTYEQALEKTYESVMPAGHSEHETGLAVDILSDTNSKMNETQADEAANKWLVENSWKYGFILRYPKDKTDITGIEYEPWHFRYVGREAAEFLHEHDMVLEEFFEHL
jgi:D-alanyl-D-alanine carboxypeptidase